MDAKLKAAWMKALRSGEYEQGRQRLRRGNDYCCLGVLCKVAGLEIDPEHGNGVVGVPFGEDDYGPIFTLLGSSDAAEQLWNRNDGLRDHRIHSFPEIADYIEANL
jgi:hypothetical protein